jgi:hypothetical protein
MGHGRYAGKMPAMIRFPSLLPIYPIFIGIIVILGTKLKYRKNWARLIQKIYEVDPLTCPKCGGIMRIISFIEDREVIKAILTPGAVVR